MEEKQRMRMRMMLLEEDDIKKKSNNKYTTTLLLCLLSCVVLVQLMPLLNGISSSSSDSIYRGLRNDPPSTYALNLDSYSKLVSTGAETYESDVFQSGGYNWTLTLYPKGKTRDGGADHISLYLKPYNTKSLPQGWEILTKISFFVQNKPRNKYLVVEEKEVQRFNAAKTEWGIGKLIQLSTFSNENNGYLMGDKCQFGAEVLVLKPNPNSEQLSFFDKGNFNWTMLHFSRLEESRFVYSDEFTVAESNWKVRVAPKGDGDGWRNYLSIYLELSETTTQSLRVNEKVYARASIVVRNINPSKNIQRQLGKWYSREVPSLGFQQFMSLADLHSPSKGYLVGDRLTLEIHFHLVSKTHYIP
ncbi:MATH/TRAF domain-containing protein [Hirschfeldia incana]|nr:MATH/TRAF domain-containing protein [Hirschfeldia incana]